LYNYLRKAVADIRPTDDKGKYLNRDGSISKSQPAPLFHREVVERNVSEVNRQFSRLRDDALWMQAMRDGSMPITKNTSFRCPQCRFFELCQADEKGNKRGVETIKSTVYTQQDPYSDHRKSAAE
jgi:hypothetical protein